MQHAIDDISENQYLGNNSETEEQSDSFLALP
jgi:hypothetical protein